MFGTQCYEQYMKVKEQMEASIEHSVGPILYEQLKRGLSMEWKQ
mgnify:FL=1